MLKAQSRLLDVTKEPAIGAIAIADGILTAGWDMGLP